VAGEQPMLSHTENQQVTMVSPCAFNYGSDLFTTHEFRLNPQSSGTRLFPSLSLKSDTFCALSFGPIYGRH
jgi:hypothetical protein